MIWATKFLVLLVKERFYCFASRSLPPCTAAFSFFSLPFWPSALIIHDEARFAFSAIRPSTQGQLPPGHINSMVRTMPPSCQLPSASIPTREKERRRGRDSVGARG